MPLAQETNLLSVGIIAVGLLNVWLLVRRNALMCAQGGLHVNLLIFYGLGPLANGFAKIYWDLYILQTLPLYLNRIQWTIFVSYIVCSVFFYFINSNKKGIQNKYGSKTISQQMAINRLTIVTLTLSVIGYFFSKTDVATSGVGTLFVVLKNILFPTLVLLIYNASFKNRLSVFLLICGFLLVGVNAFVSQWRSELIVFLFSIGAGLVLRNKKLFWIGLVLGPLFLLFVLPFQNLKKAGKIRDDQSYSDAFVISLNSKASPFDLAVNFVAYRLNYGRESAYVIRGIDRNYIEYRYGETYMEMVLQLIPRVVWPDKPSYNYYTGFVLPRKIGLSARIDRHTSWGVNYFAEFLYNFPLQALPIFFLVYWGILIWLDKLSSKMSLLPELRMLLQFALFFQVLSTVTIVNAATYFLWIFIVLKIVNYFLKPNTSYNRSYENRYLRRV
jgi:hypothetical protein